MSDAGDGSREDLADRVTAGFALNSSFANTPLK
jgi:hypothetical protein